MFEHFSNNWQVLALACSDVYDNIQDPSDPVTQFEFYVSLHSLMEAHDCSDPVQYFEIFLH
jgi:hypothetical protein